MAIALRGTAQTVGSAANPISVTLTGTQQPQTNDVLLIIHSNDFYTLGNMPTPTVGGSSTGVTAVTGTGLPVDPGADFPHIKLYTYVVPSTGDKTVAVTETGTADEEKSLAVYVYSGVDTTTPVDAAAGAFDIATSDNTHDAPSVSPTSSDAMLNCHVTTSANVTYTAPSGMAETYDFLAGSTAGTAGANLQLSASGATGIKTFTCSGATFWAAASVALKTAAGGPVFGGWPRRQHMVRHQYSFV